MRVLLLYGWVKKFHDTEDLKRVPRDICTLRKLFYQNEAGQAFKEEM